MSSVKLKAAVEKQRREPLVRCEDLLAGPAKRWPGMKLRNKHTGAIETVRSVMGTTVYFDVNGYPWSTRSVRIHWEPANSDYPTGNG